MFVGKDYTSLENEQGASLGQALALLSTIILGQRGFQETNTLAYCERS
jgi:hypothetical protein